MKIGIIGMGFVGKACYEGFKDYFSIETYDINPDVNPSCSSVDELVLNADVIFVCVPTPMKNNGACDISIIQSVMKQINDSALFKTSLTTIVIKSTVPPRTTHLFHRIYPMLNICFNPEFLTEANWLDDFLTQDRVILGNDGTATDMADIVEIYSTALPSARIVLTSSIRAEFVKYISNISLAVKVSLLNEFYDILFSIPESENTQDDWTQIVSMLSMDSRLGDSHWKVPGPDGHRGFGGTCFPKDLQALRRYAFEMDILTPILDAVWRRNIEIDRPERDWESDKGRAVSEN